MDTSSFVAQIKSIFLNLNKKIFAYIMTRWGIVIRGMSIIIRHGFWAAPAGRNTVPLLDDDYKTFDETNQVLRINSTQDYIVEKGKS